MPELGTYGSVRGAPSDGRPYRDVGRETGKSLTGQSFSVGRAGTGGLTVENQATARFTGAGNVVSPVGQTSSLTVQTGGTLVANTMSFDSGSKIVLNNGVVAAVTLTENFGTLTGTGTLGVVTTDLIGGTIVVPSSGSLLILGDVGTNSSGFLQIGAGSSLQAGAVPRYVTTIFQGAGTMATTSPGAFDSLVRNFGPGDTIDLVNTSATSLSYDPNAEVIAVSDAEGPVAYIALDNAPSATTGFALVSDGNGGTDVIAAATPSVLDLASMASDTYAASASRIDGYAPISSVSDPSGFKGVAYQNGNQIVVAFRGTNVPDDFKNLLGDASWATNSPNPTLRTYATMAASFLASVQSANPNATITVTGHSLGGALAQLTGIASGYRTVTFDAPGAASFVQSLATQLAPATALRGTGLALPITGYRTEGDMVSLVGTQPGTTITLPSETVDENTPSAQVWLYAYGNHLMGPIVANLQNGVTGSVGIPDPPGAILLGGQAVAGGAIDVATAFAEYVTPGITYAIDPGEGDNFDLSEQSDAPPVSTVGVPVIGGVASWDVTFSGIGSVVSDMNVAPGQTVTDFFGADNVDLVPLDQNGDPVAIEPFVFTASFANAGSLNADLTAACFAAGTRLATETGERMVETVRHGDMVATVAKGEIVYQPVKWVGYRRLDLTRLREPEKAQPIRMRANAFAEGVPARDLRVSPDHALLIEGLLIPARLPINGASIVRETDCSRVTYHHVELESHDILLAEGLPTESYLDTGNRGLFENGDAPPHLHPDFGEGQRRRETGSCAPFVSGPRLVEPVWRRLAARAAYKGWTVPALPELSNEPDLCVVAGEKRLKPITRKDGRYTFAIPAGGEPVRLVSRAARPCDVQPWVEDLRRLGVMVRKITLRNDQGVRDVAIDNPALDRGWWDVERFASWPCRWTNGDALLPEVGSGVLEIKLGGAMRYPSNGEGKSNWSCQKDRDEKGDVWGGRLRDRLANTVA